MRYRSWLLLVGLVLVSQARAQRPESHVPLPRRADQPDLEKIFEQRFGRAAALPELLKQLEKLLPERSAEQLLKDLKDYDWSDPELAREIQELKKLIDKEAPGLVDKLSKDKIDAIRKQFQAKFPDPILPLGKTPRLPDGIRPPDPIKGPRPVIPDNLPEPDPFEQEARAETQKIMEWLGKRLDKMSSNFADSPAFRRLATELGKIAGGEGDGRGLGIDMQLARWGRSLRQIGDRFDPAWSALRRMDMPNFSFHRPSGGFGGFAPSVSSGAWQGFGLLLVVVILVVAAWKFGWRGGRGRAAEALWHPGPWPVDLDHVSTRHELIQAFEYLSLLRLGLPAQYWNHREIAAKLGVSEAEVRSAADRVAGLYERARYAPAVEPLPADDLALARRDLRLLARVSVA